MLFGKSRKRRVIGNAYPIDCPHCANSVYYQLTKIKTRFWFFIPLNSYSNYYLTCPACESALDMNDDAEELAQDLVEWTRAYQEGELKEREYTERLSEFDSRMGIERYYEAQVEKAMEEAKSDRRREHPEFQ